MGFFLSQQARPPASVEEREQDMVIEQIGSGEFRNRRPVRSKEMPPKSSKKDPKLDRRLLLRSRRFRRLKMLPQFAVGNVYTFSGFHDWIIPDRMNLLHNDKPEGLRQ